MARGWVIPEGGLLLGSTRNLLLPSTRGAHMSVTPGEQPTPTWVAFIVCLKWMFSQANSTVFQKEIHHPCLCGYRAKIKLIGWRGLGQRTRCSRWEVPPLVWSFSRTRTSLEWKHGDWTDLEGTHPHHVIPRKPQETRLSPWGLSLLLAVSWCREFSVLNN